MNKKYYKKPTIKILVIQQISMLCNSKNRGGKSLNKDSQDSDGWIWEETLTDEDDDC